MPTVATHADGLRIESAGLEVEQLRLVGTVPGVVPLAIAGRCGPGMARVRSPDASSLQFRGPDSNWGTKVSTPAQGSYLLEADDPSQWLRVDAYPTYLRPGQEAAIFLADRYGNAIGHDDVTSGEAAAGDQTGYSVTLANDSTVVISQITVWLDADVECLEISPDNSNWFSPISEAEGISIADVAPGSTATLYLRRTIAQGAVADARVLNLLHLSYSGL